MEVKATSEEATFLAAAPSEGSLLFDSFTPPAPATTEFWDHVPLETLSFQMEPSIITTPQPPTDFAVTQDGWGNDDWGTPFRCG